ncbi:MAG: DNA-binding protein WhiA [Clostridia bacterium]|nr:DNA-binding protein WhiA [Clostridia bacterium]
MSFSSKTKNNLSRIKFEDKCCQKAELSALIRVSGTIQFRGLKRIKLTIITENAAIARHIFTLFKKTFNIHTEVLVKKNKTLKKTNSYMMMIEEAYGILEALEIIGEVDGMMGINHGMPENIVEKGCCKRAYLRGIFMGGGSVSDPERSYHLELTLHSKQYGEALSAFLMENYELEAKHIIRKNNYVLYFKDGDQIVDFLNIIGAHSALLNFENVRIVKQMRNDVNRLVNCETANLNKVVDAAVRQVRDIALIRERLGLESLPDNLRDIAEVRLENPDVSLRELGEMLEPPVGKSGVNHRLRKLEAIADSIRDTN